MQWVSKQAQSWQQPTHWQTPRPDGAPAKLSLNLVLYYIVDLCCACILILQHDMPLSNFTGRHCSSSECQIGKIGRLVLGFNRNVAFVIIIDGNVTTLEANLDFTKSIKTEMDFRGRIMFKANLCRAQWCRDYLIGPCIAKKNFWGLGCPQVCWNMIWYGLKWNDYTIREENNVFRKSLEHVEALQPRSNRESHARFALVWTISTQGHCNQNLSQNGLKNVPKQPFLPHTKLALGLDSRKWLGIVPKNAL